MAANQRSSLAELVKGRWREFIREPSAAFFVVLMPIVFMTILGFALDGDRADLYSIGWVSDSTQQANSASQRHLSALRSDPSFKVKTGTQQDLEVELRRGTILLIAKSVSNLPASGQLDSASLQLQFDPANRAARQAKDRTIDTLQRAAGRQDPLQISSIMTEAKGSRYVDFLVPGLLAMSIMSTSLFGTGMLIVANRRENLLKRYLATPMLPFQYILSHIIGRGFMLSVEVLTLMLAARIIFSFVLIGSWFDFAVFAILGAAAFTSLALLMASRTANAATFNGMTNLITLPMLLVSGVWFSRHNFPEWLAETVRWLPLTALVEGLRRIALEGVGLSSLGFEMSVLAGLLVICASSTVKLFKWY